MSYPGPNGVVVPWEGVKGPQLHPASTHLIFSILKEPTNICSCLKQDGIKRACWWFLKDVIICLIRSDSKDTYIGYAKEAKLHHACNENHSCVRQGTRDLPPPLSSKNPLWRIDLFQDLSAHFSAASVVFPRLPRVLLALYPFLGLLLLRGIQLDILSTLQYFFSDACPLSLFFLSLSLSGLLFAAFFFLT